MRAGVFIGRSDRTLVRRRPAALMTRDVSIDCLPMPRRSLDENNACPSNRVYTSIATHRGFRTRDRSEIISIISEPRGRYPLSLYFSSFSRYIVHLCSFSLFSSPSFIFEPFVKIVSSLFFSARGNVRTLKVSGHGKSRRSISKLVGTSQSGTVCVIDSATDLEIWETLKSRF